MVDRLFILGGSGEPFRPKALHCNLNEKFNFLNHAKLFVPGEARGVQMVLASFPEAGAESVLGIGIA